jgi:hypothetical protein
MVQQMERDMVVEICNPVQKGSVYEDVVTPSNVTL